MQGNLYNRRTAAGIIGVSLRQFDQLLARKEITPTRLNGRLRFTQPELDRFIASRLSKGDKLRLVRTASGLTPTELESICRLEPGTVLAVEQGRTIPQHIFALMVGSAIYAGLVNQPEAMSA